MTKYRKVAMLFLVLCLVFALTACGDTGKGELPAADKNKETGGSTKTGDNTGDNVVDNTADNEVSSEKDSLIKVSSFVVTKIWNDGFKVVRDYLSADSTYEDGEVDLEQTIATLKGNIDKLTEQDTYIKALNEQYSKVQTIWTKLYAEVQRIYAAIVDGTSSLDTKQLEIYLDDFSDAATNAK